VGEESRRVGEPVPVQRAERVERPEESASVARLMKPSAHTNAPTEQDSGSFEIANDREQVDRAIDRICSCVERHPFEKASRFAIRLSLQEGIANAFTHGHKALPPEKTIHIEYVVTKDDVTVSIEDQGPGFDPTKVPDPTLDENLEIPSGRGIMLIKAYMTDVRFNSKGNRVEMHYHRQGGP
jgi:serine/threonine-protein kinase RsbW